MSSTSKVARAREPCASSSLTSSRTSTFVSIAITRKVGGPKCARACGGLRVECLRQNRITIWVSRGKEATRTRRQYAWLETPASVAAALRARLTRRRIPFLRPNRVGRALTLEGLPGLWKRVWWYPYFECRETNFKVRRGKTFVKAHVEHRKQSAGIQGQPLIARAILKASILSLTGSYLMSNGVR